MSYTDYVTAALAKSPAGLWTLDETTGTSVVDDTGNGRTGTYAGSPSLNQTSTIPGYDGPVVNFDGTNDTISVADHASLEAVDAQGLTYQQWIKFDGAGDDKLQLIADKTGTSQANNQWGVWWDNRSSQGSPLRLRITWGDNPTGIGLDWSGTAARDALNTGGLLTVVYSPASIGYIYWNDELVASGELYNYPSTANNAANALLFRIGSLSGTGSWFDGKMGAGAVFPRDLDQWEVAALYAEGAGTAVVEVAEVSAPAKLFDTADYDSFPGLVKCPNGDLLGVWRKGTAHISASSTQGLYASRSTDDGATWGSASKIISNDASTQYMTAALSVIGSDVWLVTWVRPLAGGASSPATAVRIYSSSDDGATWTLASTVDLSSLYPNGAYTESALVYLGGYYYFGAYGQTSGTAGDFEAGVFRSSDLSTWTRVAQWDAGLDTYTETGIALIGSTLVAVVRHNSGRDHYTSTSTDGTTWSTLTKAKDVTSGAYRESNDGPGGLHYFIGRLGDPVATAYLGSVDDTGAVREVLKLNQAQNMYGQVAAVDDVRIVALWAVQASSSDADIYSARWDITGYAFSITDDAATTSAAAHLETLTIPLAIVDAAATSAAAAHVETVAIGVAVIDDAATAAAAAHLETVSIPLALTDDTATTAATAHLETVGFAGGLAITDDPATSAATAALETVVISGEQLSTTFDFVDLEDLLFVELAADADIDVAVPILSEKHPSPELTALLPAHQAWVDYTPTTSVVGFAHLWVEGGTFGPVDMTYFRGKPILVRNWTKEAPWGDKTAMWEMPQLDPWDVPGEGDLSWLTKGARVVIGIVDDVTGEVTRKWSGHYHARRKGFDSAEDYVFEAHGTMWAAMGQAIEPVPYQPPVDIGVLIPRLLNRLIGRPFNPIPETTTGILTRYRGARDERVWQAVQNILAREGWTNDGRQWTLAQVAEDEFRLALKKPMSEITGTVAWGNPGVDFDIVIDEDSRVDAVFCRWVKPGGGECANVFYPGLELLNGLPYPNADAGDHLNPGATDAGTTSGTGVSDWQQKVRDQKWTSLAVTGVMSPAWVAVVEDVQEALDLTVDGSVGPQTWTATFTTVDESINLDPRRLPLAFKSEAWPTKDGANGQILGDNPDFDGLPPNFAYLDMGTNITRAEVRANARTYLAVHGTAVVTGTMRLRGCLDDLARTDIDVGDNIEVRGFEGVDVVVQVGRLSVDLDASEGAYIVSVDIDERARDALTIDQILQRNRDALPDPARRPGNPNRTSRAVKDEGFSWDADSPCGKLTRTPINGDVGLWTRKVIPFAEVGQLAGIRLHSTVPFAMVLFESLRFTENMARDIIGDPTASADPYRPVMDQLMEYGYLGAWGAQGDMCGYSYGQESDGFPFSGLFTDLTTLEFRSETSVYVSVLFFATESGFVWGDDEDDGFLQAKQT